MLVARCCAVARRRQRAAPPASPDCHQQTIDVGRRAAAARCRTERRTGASRSLRTPHRSRMPIALHGLALRKASDAISPLNAVVEPGCCRTPPAAAAAAAFAATARAPAFKLKRSGAGGQQPRRAASGSRCVESATSPPKNSFARAREMGASKANAGEQGAPFLHANSMRSRCGRDRPGAGAKKRSASTPEAHVVGCEPAVGEADPVSHNAAATAPGEPSKTNSPKINRRRRGPKRGPDSRAPLARARV